MAVSRKGWRPITVGDQTFHWRANGVEWGIVGIVVTADAFESGATPQQLKFTLEYGPQRPLPNSGGLRQQAVITPGVIRHAIDRALTLSPPFTGTQGAPDILLAEDVVAELQALAERDFLENA